MMAPTAAYDEIADWYEQEFLSHTAAAGADPVGVGAALDALRCGTGVHSKRRACRGVLTECDGIARSVPECGGGPKAA